MIICAPFYQNQTPHTHTDRNARAEPKGKENFPLLLVLLAGDVGGLRILKTPNTQEFTVV